MSDSADDIFQKDLKMVNETEDKRTEGESHTPSNFTTGQNTFLSQSTISCVTHLGRPDARANLSLLKRDSEWTSEKGLQWHRGSRETFSFCVVKFCALMWPNEQGRSAYLGEEIAAREQTWWQIYFFLETCQVYAAPDFWCQEAKKRREFFSTS